MENNRQNNGFDDDFDDFGGFEAADPVDLGQANGGNGGVPAGPNPWAVMFPPAAPGSRNVQPDLLCGQNRFPQHLDNPLTVDVAGSAEASIAPQNSGQQADLSQEGGATGFDHDLEFNTDDGDIDFDLDNINLANDILDGSFRSTGSSQPATGLANHGPGQLPDISGLDLARGIANNSINRPEIVSNAAGAIGGGAVSNSNNVESAEVPLEQVRENRTGSSSDSMEGRAGSVEVVNQSGVVQEVGGVDNSHSAPGGEVGAAEAELVLQREALEKQELRQRLESLEVENTRLSEDLARARELADTAKASYEELQRSHESQLEDLRAAGHQTLAVVVAEYKELVATTVREQQVAGEARLVETMREEADRFRQMLQIQKEEFERLQADERRRQGEELSKALEEMKLKQQEQFDRQLAEERGRNEELMRAEIQKERDASAAEIQRVIEEERKNAQVRLESEQENFRKELAKEVEKSREEIKAAAKEQQEKSQECMCAMLEEERSRSRDSLQEAVQAVRVDMRGYLEQQRQSDRAVQRRHLASLDLFLESARQQLQLLMTTNNNNTPNNPDGDTDTPGDSLNDTQNKSGSDKS